MGTRIKRMIYLLLIGLVLGYLVLVSFVYLRQGKMLYYPIKDISETPGNIGLNFEDIVLTTKDNITISAWYIPAENERGVVLFCHGNAGNISHRLDSISIFHELGLSVFIFDYRGYGKSSGHPTEEGTYIDAEAAWDYLVNARGYQPERILLFGQSLGSAIAAETALRRKAKALIIESGFTSVPDLGARLFPYLPVKIISRFRYSTIDKVRNISIPKLFIHSPQDEIIPFKYGLTLFKNATEPKEFLQIQGDHNDGFLLTGRPYKEGLDRFISRHFE